MMWWDYMPEGLSMASPQLCPLKSSLGHNHIYLGTESFLSPSICLYFFPMLYLSFDAWVIVEGCCFSSTVPKFSSLPVWIWISALCMLFRLQFLVQRSMWCITCISLFSHGPSRHLFYCKNPKEQKALIIIILVARLLVCSSIMPRQVFAHPNFP